MGKQKTQTTLLIICSFVSCVIIFILNIYKDKVHMSDKQILWVFVGLIAATAAGLVWGYRQHVLYMEEQKINNSDKAMLLHRMKEELGERYNAYSYVTAYVHSSHRHHRHNSPVKDYPRIPYIIVFNNTETILYRFQIRQNTIQLFPPKILSWATISWKYHISEDKIELVLANDPSLLNVAEFMPLAGQKLNIDKVLFSARNKMIALHPLGIYQENEFRQFANCLSGYPNSQRY